MIVVDARSMSNCLNVTKWKYLLEKLLSINLPLSFNHGIHKTLEFHCLMPTQFHPITCNLLLRQQNDWGCCTIIAKKNGQMIKCVEFVPLFIKLFAFVCIACIPEHRSVHESAFRGILPVSAPLQSAVKTKLFIASAKVLIELLSSISIWSGNCFDSSSLTNYPSWQSLHRTLQSVTQ